MSQFSSRIGESDDKLIYLSLQNGYVYMEVQSSDLIKEEPTLNDFFRDMNEHNAEYSIRGEHVIELERDIKDRKMGRITIWKAQKVNGGFVPSPRKGVQYDWYGVARRFMKFDKETPRTLSEMDYHFEETLREYPYEGPRDRNEVKVID